MVGVGNDIEAEQKLSRLLPQCKFFGADAIYETGRVFEKVGTFFHTAVGSGNRTIHARVLTNETYENMDLKSTDFYELLAMTGAQMIDYLLLDAEGAEYSILSMLDKS
uniref:Methyltransferase FkbM domain-containing protein n=1 Tax=Romanomermis culicivorax TaxID=13658 RepID=A0A915L053_ROMCU